MKKLFLTLFSLIAIVPMSAMTPDTTADTDVESVKITENKTNWKKTIVKALKGPGIKATIFAAASVSFWKSAQQYRYYGSHYQNRDIYISLNIWSGIMGAISSLYVGSLLITLLTEQEMDTVERDLTDQEVQTTFMHNDVESLS